MESPVVAALCLLGAVATVAQAALAGPDQWNSYLKLLEESRWGQYVGAGAVGHAAVAPAWRRLEVRVATGPALSFTRPMQHAVAPPPASIPHSDLLT